MQEPSYHTVKLAAFLLLLLTLSACHIAPEREALFATVSNMDVTAIAVTPESAEGALSTRAGRIDVQAETLEAELVIGQPTAPAPETPPPSEVAQVNPRAEALHAYLTDMTDSGQFMGAVLIADEGRILINDGFGMANVATSRPNTSQTQLRIGSLTKQFTAAAILRLQEQGKLNLDDPVSNYLPEYPGGDRFTIHQLLTHTAGVPSYTRRPDLASVVQAPIALDELLAEFSSQSLDFQPGQGYAYSDSGYVILTAVIEGVSGQAYDEFMHKEFFVPLAMDRSGYDFVHDELVEGAAGYRMTPGGPQQAIDTESSWASGAGALYSTVEDLFRWDRALSSGNMLQESSMEAMFEPWAETGQGFSYGYGWELGQMAGRPSQMHAGTIFGFGSFFSRFPEDDATIIVLGNGLQFPPRKIAEELARLLFN
jgi:CubicO group peptidase (beta-lactamase class C family)